MRVRAVVSVAAALALGAALATCSRRAEERTEPVPSPSPAATGVESAGELAGVPLPRVRTVPPDSPPLIWVGGRLAGVAPERLEVLEASGPTIVLQRLGAGATAFFRAEDGAWRRADPPEAPGEQACIETLMDGRTLLAIRVFLGADCGPR